jgi:malate dehydrogenase (quinone)
MPSTAQSEPDVVLIGAGIMSSTLGVLLRQLEPSMSLEMFEVLEGPGLESSQAWNNAGTGHAANCELNYTPERSDGSVDISQALQVNVEFDLSRQLWSFLVKRGSIPDPQVFIHPVPHMSFVWGAENVAFLRKRFAAMTSSHCYRGMEYSEDRKKIADWVPLVIEGRTGSDPLAATRIITGTDVDYGALTRLLVAHLEKLPSFNAHYLHRVTGIERNGDGRWRVEVKELKSEKTLSVTTKFVFIGAGGGALPLLQKSKIPEARGYGGFPVSGIWLRCDASNVTGRHHAKVYGKASVGSPPMSVPHLDTRVIDGWRSLLFGPYAGFSTKFLKQGSLLDLFESVELSNIEPMLAVARDNFALTEYLLAQVLQSATHRFDALRAYFPQAREGDWKMQIADQRVQIIKPDPEAGGRLEFGTELVAAHDRSLVALLGASPGASTAAYIAISVLQKCFASELAGAAWLPRLKEIIPSYGISLIDDVETCNRVRADTAAALKIEYL